MNDMSDKYNQAKSFLKHYRSPFLKISNPREDEDIGTLHSLFENSKLAKLTDKIVTKLGVVSRPWNTLTHFTLYNFMFLTCIGLFFRPDFYSLTFCMAALIELMFES